MGSCYLRVEGSITLSDTFTPANSSGMRLADGELEEA
jgi:hypothetical protein